MIDFFFKLYFSYCRNKGAIGAGRAAMAVSVPLAFNIWLLLLYVVSFVFPIRIMAAPLLVFPLGILCFLIGMFFRRRYEYKERYKVIKFDSVFLYYVLGVVHFFFSIFSFIYFGNELYRS